MTESGTIMPAKTSRNIIERKNMKNTSFLYDGIVKNHKKEIDSSIDTSMRVISKHINDLGMMLATPGPEKRISFSKINEDNFIESVGIDISNITNSINECPLIKKHFLTYTNPFYILISNLISYHYKNKTTHNKIEIGKVFNLYLTLRIYKAAFGTFFPNYLPNPEAMAATIENLGSNRFNIKKYKTIFATLVYISESHYENFHDILETPIDDNILYYISNLYGRIKLMMRLISNKYYENHANGVRQGTDNLQEEGSDGDMYLKEIDNVSTLVAINSRKIYLYFVSDSVANPKILRSVCEITGVSFSKMCITVNKMLESREPMIESLLVKILSHFYSSGGTVIKSAKFVNHSIEIYKVSNSADQTIIEIKRLLDSIMNKYSESYKMTSHVGLLSNMRKTIYLYIILYACDVM